MFYKSTRNSEVKVSSAQAIAQGISEDGGLFVPSVIPAITLDDIKALGEKSYAERAFFVFSKYLTDFTEAEIRYCVEGAYNTKNFDTDNIAALPVSPDVATRITTFLSTPSFLIEVVSRYGSIWRAISLNAQVGPCHSSSI